MEKPTVAPNDPAVLPDEAAAGEGRRPADAGAAKPAAKRVRASKSGTKKAGTKKAGTKKAGTKKPAAKKASAKQAAARPAPAEPAASAEFSAEATPADTTPVDAVRTGDSAWRLHGVSQATRDLAAVAANRAGVPVDDWVDRTLAEAAGRAIDPGPAASGSMADLLPSIGELSQKLEMLRYTIGNEDSPVAKLAGQLKGSADEIAANLGQRFKTAAEKAPPLDEVTARLKQSVRYAREHAALDEVAGKWREHVDKSKWREHVRQARQVAGGMIGEVKGKAEGAIEDLWNRQSRDAEKPEQNDERRDGTG